MSILYTTDIPSITFQYKQKDGFIPLCIGKKTKLLYVILDGDFSVLLSKNEIEKIKSNNFIHSLKVLKKINKNILINPMENCIFRNENDKEIFNNWYKQK
ncbi:hypothetical protein M153_28000001853 [Pseudoloma neurophilia]|uniref:Uncharacterized protein n=1 Tax=Pseudoloma neurophilia TaxID=146866 RepID=A0A0R0LU60_9MICR|nr:hypothetical protein M153_28000001853 [Pseudoloma neurophilia]